MNLFPRSEELIESIAREFPSFAIRKKSSSSLQRSIDIALRVVTFGQMRTYLSHYHTVLFGTLWVPDAWERMADLDRYVLLRHERIHLRQRARMGDFVMGVVYLFPFFPIGLAYGRARIEWEAYIETIRATAEVYGMDRARSLREPILSRFIGPDYGWMWPFPRTLNTWFDRALATVETELFSEANR